MDLLKIPFFRACGKNEDPNVAYLEEHIYRTLSSSCIDEANTYAPPKRQSSDQCPIPQKKRGNQHDTSTPSTSTNANSSQPTTLARPNQSYSMDEVSGSCNGYTMTEDDKSLAMKIVDKVKNTSSTKIATARNFIWFSFYHNEEVLCRLKIPKNGLNLKDSSELTWCDGLWTTERKIHFGILSFLLKRTGNQQVHKLLDPLLMFAGRRPEPKFS
eukprot:GHVP01048651.1.p1 GENE.GHVP01048651.1~~GHVP01048651.1.p1  ORF type:complete len:214 (-),score=29.99 GHVP01048651.1:6-647(-)